MLAPPVTVLDQEVLVLEFLVRHRVDEAAAAALRLGLLRLATLIPLAGEEPARSLVAEQVRCSYVMYGGRTYSQ